MRSMTFAQLNGRWLAIAMLTMFVAAPSAAASTADADLQREVEQRLSKKEAVAAKIDVAVANDVVTLTGVLASLWETEWAVERVEKTDGVVTVVSQLTIVVPRPDADLAALVADAIGRYPYYTVFDHVTASVQNGVVTLKGDVTATPDKPADIRERVSKVVGVHQIVNDIEILSPGIGDGRLRYALARQLFSHPSLGRYNGYNPGIHIIVKTGYVTLKGTVYDEGDRLIADSVARRTFGVIRVYNELKLRNEVVVPAAAPPTRSGVVN
ncbi:MAG: BON domain-containing protein [bacterium]